MDAQILEYLLSPGFKGCLRSNTPAAAAVSWCYIPESIWEGNHGHDLIQAIDRAARDASGAIADRGTIMDLLEDPEVILILLKA